MSEYSKRMNKHQIIFCSMAQYDKLLSENKIDKNIVYFIDDSIQDMQPLSTIFNESKPIKNIFGIPVRC